MARRPNDGPDPAKIESPEAEISKAAVRGGLHCHDRT